MKYMFYSCKSPKSLILPEISNTSSLERIESMFCSCKSLIYLNLSAFNTSLVKSMRKTFMAVPL